MKRKSWLFVLFTLSVYTVWMSLLNELMTRIIFLRNVFVSQSNSNMLNSYSFLKNLHITSMLCGITGNKVCRSQCPLIPISRWSHLCVVPSHTESGLPVWQVQCPKALMQPWESPAAWGARVPTTAVSHFQGNPPVPVTPLGLLALIPDSVEWRHISPAVLCLEFLCKETMRY